MEPWTLMGHRKSRLDKGWNISEATEDTNRGQRGMNARQWLSIEEEGKLMGQDRQSKQCEGTYRGMEKKDCEVTEGH